LLTAECAWASHALFGQMKPNLESRISPAY
jgi:hypothetical protein